MAIMKKIEKNKTFFPFGFMEKSNIEKEKENK
jgi:hypothetical protein